MQYLSVDEALDFILTAFNPLEAQPVEVGHALGRILAEDVLSPLNIPPFTNSAMDGYAIRAVDTAGATPESPARLRLVAEVAAGQVCDQILGPGMAIRIMTGAALPQGADAVVRFEDTTEGFFDFSITSPATFPGSKDSLTGNRHKPQEVGVYIQASPGLNVRQEGEDVQAGRLVLQAGTRLNPGHLGLLAAMGITTLGCARRPHVGILATGSELLEPGQPLTPGKIYNSNNPMLAALVVGCGAEAVMLGNASDNWEVIRSRLVEGLRLGVDLILTSGGVAVGDYDLLKQVLQAEGQLDMWQVRMRQGKPLAFGHLGGIPLLGLPGNPLAPLVSFELFARPAILKMQGLTPILAPLEANLAAPIHNPSGQRNFLRGKMGLQGTNLWVWPGETLKSSQLASLIESDCLIVAHEERSSYVPGDRIGIIPLYGPGLNQTNTMSRATNPTVTRINNS